MATSLITNKAIRQSEYISTKTVRVPRDVVERRDMGALFMCQDKRVPFGRQLTFKTADEVCRHFGVNSEQYKIAKRYFNYTEENTDKQTQISFGRWTRGSETKTYTTMLTRLHKDNFKESNGNIIGRLYDVQRDARALLLEPMEWFNVEGFDKTVQGFVAWFDSQYNTDESSDVKYRGIVAMQTRSDATPTIYYAPSADGDAWIRIDRPSDTDKQTFMLYMENACRYDTVNGYVAKSALDHFGDGDLFHCYVDDEGFPYVETWFMLDKYFDRFVKAATIEPTFNIVGDFTAEELGVYETDSSADNMTNGFIAASIANGTMYRTVESGNNSTEYKYTVWDRQHKRWDSAGINGRIDNCDFFFDTVDEMRQRMTSDVRTLKDEKTILEVVDRDTCKTYYKKYDAETNKIVDAVERLKDGVYNMESSVLFEDVEYGTVEDLDATEYEDGDIVPLVSEEDFRTRFYRLTGGVFTLVTINGEESFNIVDNYPEYNYTANDSIENLADGESADDGDYCVVLDVAGKTLHSTYYRYDGAGGEWKVVEAMRDVDIPANYPDSNDYYTITGIKKVSAEGEAEDYEPEFSEDITDAENGEFTSYVDYTADDFVRYYFVYDLAQGKFVYVRKSSDIENYPYDDFSVSSMKELYEIDLSYYTTDEDEERFLVARVSDRYTFYTSYWCYSTKTKKWSIRGGMRDIISDYPVSGILTSIPDQHNLSEIEKILSDDGMFACINKDYYPDYGEAYYSWHFSLEKWELIYSNIIRETDANYKGNDYQGIIQSSEEMANKYGYPDLNGVYHVTDDDTYWMWMEVYDLWTGYHQQFYQLVVKEDKNGDGVYFTDTETFVELQNLVTTVPATTDTTTRSATTMYVNSHTGSKYVYLEGDWRKIVLTKSAKDSVELKRLVGAEIENAITDFRTDINGVVLKITTNQTHLAPTGKETYGNKQLVYSIPFICRHDIEDFKTLASLLQSQIRIMRGLESVSVYAVKEMGKTRLEIEFEDSIGITSVTGVGANALYAEMLGFSDDSVTVKTVSSFYKESPVEAIQRISSLCNNFGSFSFMDEPIYDNTVEGGANIVGYEQSITPDEIDAICEWNKAENFMYLYAQGLREATKNDETGEYDFSFLPNSGNGLGTAIEVRGGDGHDYEELIPMSVFAATEYEEPESVTGFMFKRFNTGEFTPSVGKTDESFATLTKAEQWNAQKSETAKMKAYDEHMLNYVVRTQEFGLKRRDYFQRGKCLDGMDISTYCSEVWLKDAFATALLKLLMQYEKLTPTVSSLTLASAVMIPIIDEAGQNGMMVIPEEPLPDSTRIYIDQQTGVEESYKEIEKDGYLLQFDFVTDVKYGGKAIFYRFMYCKNGDIRKIEGYQAYQE